MAPFPALLAAHHMGPPILGYFVSAATAETDARWRCIPRISLFTRECCI